MDVRPWLRLHKFDGSGPAGHTRRGCDTLPQSVVRYSDGISMFAFIVIAARTGRMNSVQQAIPWVAGDQQPSLAFLHAHV
jgi:hypothetical protein